MKFECRIFSVPNDSSRIWTKFRRLQCAKTMVWLLLTLNLLVITGPFSIQTLLTNLSEPLHQGCITFWLNQASEFKTLYSAMTCGSDQIPADMVQLFRQSGLYHLLVISGSHLVFLTQILDPIAKRLAFGQMILLVGLCLFCLVANVEPPIIRAMFSIVLGWIARRWRWRSAHLHLLSALMVLALFPLWIMSLSFWLSWIAAIAVSLASRWSGQPAIQATVIYLILLPVVSQLGLSHPSHILFNSMMAGVLGLGMFPLSLVVSVIPSAVYLVDPIWSLVLKILTLFASDLPLAPGKFDHQFIALYTLTIQLGYLLGGIWWRRYKT